MHVRLAKSEFKIRKPSLELFGQPRICDKATNEKCELIVMNQGLGSMIPECTDRVGGRVLLEAIFNSVHSRPNRGFEEPINLRAACENVSAPIRSFIERVRVYSVNFNLPRLTPQLGSLYFEEPSLMY